MSFIELDRPPLEGALNTNVFTLGSRGDVLLQRNPRKNPEIAASLEYEYHFMGFTELGGYFRQRNPREQDVFARHAAAHGLRVLPPAFLDERGGSTFHFWKVSKRWMYFCQLPVSLI